DLQTAWESTTTGRAPDLPPVPTSFRHWTRHLTETAGQLRTELPLWHDILNHPDPQLGLRDLSPEVDTWASAEQRSFTLSGEQAVSLISELPTAFRCNVEDVLLTALALAMREWRRGSGGADVPGLLVEIERHGRGDEVDVSRTVGWFTTVFPVHLDPGEALVGGVSEAVTVESSLKRVKEQLRAVPGNGIGYGLLRYVDPDSSWELRGGPDPQVLFNYLGRVSDGGADEAGGSGNWTLLTSENVGEGADPEMPMSHSLVVNAVTRGTPDVPELLISLSWPGGLLGEDRIVELSEGMCRALAALSDLAGRAGAGGLTPSDVVLLDLGQDEIEEFELDEL
ncbi:condensation domain-containing protein, partial [Streptomyces sp. NPDC054864]